MANDDIRFDDGAAYERYMGLWSRSAGGAFLDWVAPERGLRWLDVGCGNGAFTELLVGRGGAGFVEGIDPSAEQLAFARGRFAPDVAAFRQGDAMAVPFDDDAFDAAVMPLVIFFVPEPARGVGEMARVVRAGGLVTAYAWDMEGGGFPYAALQEEMRALGAQVKTPPRPEASRVDVMGELWRGAGLEEVETRALNVQRTFEDFEDYWTTVRGGPSVGAGLAAMGAGEVEVLRGRLRERLGADGDGRIKCSARANAVKGRVRRGG